MLGIALTFLVPIRIPRTLIKSWIVVRLFILLVCVPEIYLESTVVPGPKLWKADPTNGCHRNQIKIQGMPRLRISFILVATWVGVVICPGIDQRKRRGEKIERVSIAVARTVLAHFGYEVSGGTMPRIIFGSPPAILRAEESSGCSSRPGFPPSPSSGLKPYRPCQHTFYAPEEIVQPCRKTLDSYLLAAANFRLDRAGTDRRWMRMRYFGNLIRGTIGLLSLRTTVRTFCKESNA